MRSGASFYFGRGRKPDKEENAVVNVIIVGCGRVGSQLATMLSSNDATVCVVDRKA